MNTLFMRNIVRVIGIAAVALNGAVAAHAWDAAGPVYTGGTMFGTCAVTVTNDPATPEISIFVQPADAPKSVYNADNAYYFPYGKGSHTAANGGNMKEAAPYCGLLPIEIDTIVEWSDGTSYETATRYGFSYTDGAGTKHEYSFSARTSSTTTNEAAINEAATNANAMIARAHALAANQSDLSGLLSGGSASLSGGGNGENGAIDFASNPNNPVWVNVKSSWSENDTSKTKTTFAEAGAHYKINPNLLVGAMVQFDINKTAQDAVDTKSTGWMVGPYVVAKLPDHPLYFEARGLYGQTSNEMTNGTTTDKYDTKRYLLKGKVTGELDFDTYKLLPNISGLYTRDNQESYTNSAGTTVASQSVTYSEVTAGLDIIIPIMLDMGKINLKAGFDAIYSNTNADALTSAELDGYNDFHGRVDLGFDYAITSSALLNFNSYYDGIGANDNETIGLEAGLAIKF